MGATLPGSRSLPALPRPKRRRDGLYTLHPRRRSRRSPAGYLCGARRRLTISRRRHHLVVDSRQSSVTEDSERWTTKRYLRACRSPANRLKKRRRRAVEGGTSLLLCAPSRLVRSARSWRDALADDILGSITYAFRSSRLFLLG